MSDPVLSIRGLRKEYGTGVQALKSVDLDINRGEIFALLGPNGAGKTTLINIVCGIVTPTSGEVLVDGRNWRDDYRHARSRIGQSARLHYRLVRLVKDHHRRDDDQGTFQHGREVFGLVMSERVAAIGRL